MVVEVYWAISHVPVCVTLLSFTGQWLQFFMTSHHNIESSAKISDRLHDEDTVYHGIYVLSEASFVS